MANTFIVHDARELLTRPAPKFVEVENGEIGFIGHQYWIELDRIKTRAALLEWIHHLLGKRWVTNDMLSDFIEKVCEIRKWKLYNDV